MNNITKPTMGLYGGSFDPFHIGHLDIVNQAKQVFDEVLVAKGINPTKVDKVTSRYPLPEKFLARLGVHTVSFNTLIIDQVKKLEKDYNVTLVRGLRNGADLDYEQNLVAFLREMYPQIKIIAFYCDPRFRHVSSSALRDIEKFSPVEYRKYVVTD